MKKAFRILSIAVCVGATVGGYDAWADDSRVVDVSSKEEYEKAVSGSGMTVVMFKAGWCGACKQASPKLDALSNEMSDVTFVRADIDKVRNVEGIQVRAIPTFRYYRDGALLKKENVGAPANFAEQMANNIEQARQEAGEAPAAKAVEKAPEAQAPAQEPMMPVDDSVPSDGGFMGKVIGFITYLISMVKDLINAMISSLRGLLGL